MDHDSQLDQLLNTKPNQPRIARFAPVSDGQFAADLHKAFDAGELRGMDGKPLSELPENAVPDALAIRKLPLRATVGSAGYDFFSPIAFRLLPGDSITIPTGIRCAMDPGWVLIIAPKSGKGNRFRVMLRNTLGFIDSDYYFSDNEGHIILNLINDNYDSRPMDIRAGDALMQGLFLPYGITIDDAAEGIRNGGFGSTVR